MTTDKGFPPKKLPPEVSLFLDIIRLFSALVVVLVHAYDQIYTNKSDFDFGKLSHGAVIVFFVLSGYVIGLTTTVNNRGPLHYTLARLNRLYSVLLPGILITASIQLFVFYVSPALYDHYSRGSAFPRYLLSFFFMNEVMNLSAAPPINSPLWSLSYEFWYYLIFGVWFYASKKSGSIIVSVLVSLLAGAKILLLLPVWLMGYFSFRLSGRVFQAKDWSITVTFLLLSVVYIGLIGAYPYSIGAPPFFFANQFFTDYGLGLLLGCAFIFLPVSKPVLRKYSVSGFRKIADMTFPLYLLHFPFLVFWRSIITFKANDNTSLILLILLAVISSALFGLVIEKFKSYWQIRPDYFSKTIRRNET